jgi:hypothetical protein
MKTVKRIDLEYRYDHDITFRRSSFTRAAWEQIVHKFSITQAEPSKIKSITIEGEDDFGHLQLSIMVEV